MSILVFPPTDKIISAVFGGHLKFRAEILQKEENDLLILEIREDIVEDALNICYEKYMERQTSLFTAHCAAEAWIKLIDWYFYRHDPGEEPSAHPQCFIPKRTESWIPDEIPDPSPKDTWCKHELTVLEDPQDEIAKKSDSSHSLDMPIIEDIPSEFWFPGKVNLPYENESKTFTDTDSGISDYNICTESEVLQKVTDYSSSEKLLAKESSLTAEQLSSPLDGSVQSAAGDSAMDRNKPKRRLYEKNKSVSKARSRGYLPPLAGESRSLVSIISDCRLRNLRLETQYEIASEKIDTPPGETVKRK
ncbi:uncharacterized protein LOC126965320 isoform X2 [Leptidea sinapis]|uniref:uncharacterized protein LOC126965320 isoform X2 n=1 Tax=Leptidea sinapis TaxID=189913 RepID=UPI0021C28717|nr:uncharacterized protein LOC126965320 isoform X2 [Leptidea sinapis]